MINMESPLEVLSRAASMVETSDAAREAALKRSLQEDKDDVDLPPKFKYRHLAAKSKSTDTFGPEDGDHINNRRCAGTQTSFTSFMDEMYPNQRPPDYKLLDLDRLSKCTPAPPTTHMPARHPHIPPVLSSKPAPSAYAQGRAVRLSPLAERTPSSPAEDAHAAPLNLTTSVAAASPQQHRPSVITLVPSSYGGSSSQAAAAAHSPAPRSPNCSDGSYRVTPETDVRLCILPSEPCGTSIDEHFRRSLGQDYQTAVYGSAPASPQTGSSGSPERTRTPPSPTPAPHTHQQPAVPPGSVDDHFAKSLGDKWREINPPAIKEPTEQAGILAGSVDDHFTKALGDTWLRIKANTKQRPDAAPADSSPVVASTDVAGKK